MRKGTSGSASVVVRAAPQEVFDTISDVGRIPEWSPECVHARWLDDEGLREGARFLARNRRGLLRWSNRPLVTVADPPREFGFVISQPPFGELTRWSYRVDPGPEPGTSQVTESFELVRDQPKVNKWVVRLLGGVSDREQDLQRNLETSLERLRVVIEEAGPPEQRESP